MNKRIITTAAIFGAIAVICGAFGAHALKAVLLPRQLEVWQTGVQYQFYHVFALLFLSTFSRVKTGLINAAFYLFTFGIVLFSGSLYLLACRDILKMPGLSVVGPVTPIGGLLFIAGWVSLALAALKNK
ncbi:DUF423 domain-containing protein [Mucilaginibacter terrenus]|uniref:DUF423 domain-containing protein n=1 Tax=Mucilaginibacter terrenus TaxID=2482727 RepID=A0A3E2NTS6_9SPHI|nr:DUF423 domain-containing protein [Mucilaginibacter terrenus]RFZ84321.1 DUF423 domain-containing protein [Mucilaginibacter terrenus]